MPLLIGADGIQIGNAVIMMIGKHGWLFNLFEQRQPVYSRHTILESSTSAFCSPALQYFRATQMYRLNLLQRARLPPNGWNYRRPDVLVAANVTFISDRQVKRENRYDGQLVNLLA